MLGEITLSFNLPDSQLTLSGADLDYWAEHLTWCLGLAGVGADATIGVVDYGTSPVAFLGSALLTPMLDAGVAERLPGRVICLDASRERVALVPSILRQLHLDVLIVRQEVMPALITYCREADQGLEDILIITTQDTNTREPSVLIRSSRRLLVAESAMLMAPECAHCAKLHLRHSHYAPGPNGSVVTLRGGSQTSLPHGIRVLEQKCSQSPQDALLEQRAP
jgi:hypothetical protein